jgi:hypothetical protein
MAEKLQGATMDIDPDEFIDPREYNLFKAAYSVPEFMALTDASRATTYQWVRAGLLPLAHFGRRTVILAPAIARLLRIMQTEGLPSRPETPEERTRRLAKGPSAPAKEAKPAKYGKPPPLPLAETIAARAQRLDREQEARSKPLRPARGEEAAKPAPQPLLPSRAETTAERARRLARARRKAEEQERV